MSLRNMNIAPRAFLGFAFIGALMLLLGVFALNQMSKIRAATEDITSASVPSIRALDEFTQLTLRLRVLYRRLWQWVRVLRGVGSAVCCRPGSGLSHRYRRARQGLLSQLPCCSMRMHGVVLCLLAGCVFGGSGAIGCCHFFAVT